MQYDYVKMQQASLQLHLLHHQIELELAVSPSSVFSKYEHDC